jgi:putative intracellular protease/amidase
MPGGRSHGVDSILKDNNYVFVSTELKNAGGNFVEPKGPWDDFSVVDGKLASEKKKPVFFPLG